MRMLDLFPQDKREKVLKEGSLELLLSAFLSISKDVIERGEDIEVLKEELRRLNDKDSDKDKDDKNVSMPVSTHNYSFHK